MKPSNSLIVLPGRACAVCLLLSISAFSQDTTLERLIDAGRAAMREKNWQQALDLHTQAAVRFGGDDPRRKYGAQFGSIFYHKGVCEMKLKQWEDAMRSFETCYRDFPNEGGDSGNSFQIMALCKWGESAMGAAKWDVAASRFAKFIEERDRTRDKFPQGSFYVNIAVCQYRLGRIAEGNENLEIAIHNKENFPTPESGIVAGFEALVVAAIAQSNEQSLLDFIGKNRGALVMDSSENQSHAGIFLKLAGDALAAGMRRAALTLYQLVPTSEADEPDSPAGIRLAAIALIHEKSGNIRGAYAAYEQLVLDHPAAANREDHLYQLVRTASIVAGSEAARPYAQRLYREFPKSAHLDEFRAMGFDFTAEEAATVRVKSAVSVKALPKSREFSLALDLYQGRKYLEAKAAFHEIETRRKPATAAEGAASTFAAFYGIECLRKLGDLDGMAVALRGFEKSPSLGGDRLRQLEINGLWDAVRSNEWERLDALAKELGNQRLPADQRAQVAYCQGLAFENRGHPTEALNAYNTAMTADAGASEEIARQAALNVMRIHRADPEVREAIIHWGTPGERKEGAGFLRLREAASVAHLFELCLGAATPLPGELGEFLRYKGHP